MATFPYTERAMAAEAARRALALAHHRWLQDRCEASRREWTNCVEIFGGRIHHAYPPGFWEGVEGLRNGDPAFLDGAIEFLEADPFFFRSGYAKSRIARFLKRHEFSQHQARRLRGALLAAVERPGRREFRDFCRLARRLADDAMRQYLLALAAGGDAAVMRQAAWMLNALDG